MNNVNSKQNTTALRKNFLCEGKKYGLNIYIYLVYELIIPRDEFLIQNKWIYYLNKIKKEANNARLFSLSRIQYLNSKYNLEFPGAIMFILYITIYILYNLSPSVHHYHSTEVFTSNLQNMNISCVCSMEGLG